MADGGDGIVIPFPSNSNDIESRLYDEPPSKTELFLETIGQLATVGMATVRNKNCDYAGAGDPFQNFKASESIGVGLSRAILVRMMDKITRISNLISRPPAVTNESLMDTCIDLSNYALILATYIKMNGSADE